MQKNNKTFWADLKSTLSEGMPKTKFSDDVGSFSEPFKNLFSPINYKWSTRKQMDYSNDPRFHTNFMPEDVFDRLQKIATVLVSVAMIAGAYFRYFF